ncbi:MAG: hypothetical protein LBO77_08005, partial [Desulfovibrio sp.]|nr:hypothetical protein [Desulfovibrio sp.]
MNKSFSRTQASPIVPESAKKNRRPLWFGIFITVVLIGATFAVAYHQILANRERMESEILQRQRAISETRAGSAD